MNNEINHGTQVSDDSACQQTRSEASRQLGNSIELNMNVVMKAIGGPVATQLHVRSSAFSGEHIDRKRRRLQEIQREVCNPDALDESRHKAVIQKFGEKNRDR